MARFKKDVLYPGTYRLPDGRRVTYTRADVKHLRQRAKDMLAAGLPVPVCWAHQDQAKPETEQERAARRAEREKWSLGWAADAEESRDGFLEMDLEVPSDEDARRLPSVRFVSPEIVEDFVDGTGRLWPGKSITHVAVVSRPVHHNQQSFRPVQMGFAGKAVWLSLEGYEMAEEKDDKSKKGDDEGGGGGELKDLIEALKGAGINVPDEVNDLAGLIIAVKASSGNTDSGSLDDTAAIDGGADGSDVGEGSPPVMMGMDSVFARKAMAAERDKLKRRINALASTGRINKKLRANMLGQVDAVRLGFDAKGDLKPHRLIAQIEAYEQLDASPFLRGGKRPAQLSLDADDDLEEVGAPARRKGDDSPEATDAAVDGWDEMLGRKAAR